MSCSAWDKGDEDLDGPRSARIWPFSECDYTPYSVILWPQQEGFTNDFVRLVNLALLGVHGMEMLTMFSARTAGAVCYACTTHLSRC